MNYLKFKRYVFSTLLKDVNSFIHYQLRALRRLVNRSYSFVKNYNIPNFSRTFKYINYRIYKFNNFSNKYINFRNYKFNNLSKILSLKKFKNFTVYLISFIFLTIIIYLNIPNFFNYDKSFLNKACENFNLNCMAESEIGYTFIPTPRLELKNLTILDSKKRTLVTVPEVQIKISIHKLINKNKFNFTKIVVKNSEINLHMGDVKEYKKFIKKLNFVKPIVVKKGNINFFDGEEKITTIKKASIKFKSLNDINIKGNFLNDELLLSLEGSKNKSKTFVLKLIESKILAKVNINEGNTEDKIQGNILLKKNKHRLRSAFSYKKSHIFFEEADIRNEFLNGKFDGFIKLLPFFDFNLNVDLKGLNFKRFYTVISNIDKKRISKFLKTNYKINGDLNLNVGKVYSKYDLINSSESHIKLSNGDILIEKMLLNLGKLGAADITGIIKNDKKFSNFKFESNIYIDNEKYFNRKFGIFSNTGIFENLYLSGSLDLLNFNMRFSEISSDKKFNEKQIFRIEKEFNTYMLDDGVISFFDFTRFKEFMGSIISNEN